MCYNILEVVIMKKYNFTILIEKDEDGMYVASVPALKGCHTQAKTVEELLPRIKEAIELCLECEKEDILQNEFIGVQQIEVVV
jgi:predicted RNase H-like HicB family nuclease